MESAITITDCEHQLIYDVETSEDICTICGIVLLPSYKPGDNEEPEQVDMFAKMYTEDGHELTEEEKKKLKMKGYLVPKPTKVDFSCGGFKSTKIDSRNVDFVGKRINSAQFTKLRYINSYIASSAGMATFRNAVWRIDSYSTKLHLPTHIKERAAELFEKIYYFRTNIHNSENIVCSCIYYACKEAMIDRTMQDIAKVAQKSDKYASHIFMTYQVLIDALTLDSPKNLLISDHIEHFGSKMGLKQRIIRYAIHIYRKVRSSGKLGRIYFAGKAPRITAVALLYISASIFSKHHYVPVTKFAKSADLTDYIFRKRVEDHLRSENFKLYRPYVNIV